MQVGEHVDQIEPSGPTVLDREQRTLVGTVEHDPVDETHHIERRAVHCVIGAQTERRRHGHG